MQMVVADAQAIQRIVEHIRRRQMRLSGRMNGSI